MKYFIKKFCLSTILTLTVFFNFEVIGAENKTKYSAENFTNYLSGVMALNANNNKTALKYFNEIDLNNFKHSNLNIEFIRTLVLLEKFDDAIALSKKTWKKEDVFFEADLLLGINFFIKRDYVSAEKHFKRLNKISRYNIFFDNFIGNILLSWNEAVQNNQEKSFNFLKKIPK